LSLLTLETSTNFNDDFHSCTHCDLQTKLKLNLLPCLKSAVTLPREILYIPLFIHIYLLKFEASVRLRVPWTQKALTLYPATKCTAATIIRCQRSLAVKPLTMSGSPSHRGSVHRQSRSQVTHVPISNCSCSMCAMTVSKLMSTCGNYSCASVRIQWGLSQRACPSTGAFRTLQVKPQSRFSHNRAKRDCGLLSRITGIIYD